MVVSFWFKVHSLKSIACSFMLIGKPSRRFAGRFFYGEKSPAKRIEAIS